MEKPEINNMLDATMMAIQNARVQAGKGEGPDLKHAAELVNRCYQAISSLATEDAIALQSRLIGVIDEIEQLNAELIKAQNDIRRSFKSLTQATQAQRTYRSVTKR